MKRLRSNSKEVKEAIRLHLIEIAQNDDVEVETVEEAIRYIADRFSNEMLKYNNKMLKIDRSERSLQNLFIYWISGLSLHTHYCISDIIDYLHGIDLYGKNEEQEREKAADLYHYLIFKEVRSAIFDLYNK